MKTAEFPSAARPPRGERRQLPRRKARGSARYRFQGRQAGAVQAARLVDLSQGGVALLTREKLPVGARLEVELIAPAGLKILAFAAETRWAVTAGPGQFMVGCSWDAPLGFSDLHWFI